MTVPKTGLPFTGVIPAATVDAWLVNGIARVLGDAHAGIKSEDYPDDAACHAAVETAMRKRLAAGPGAESGSRTTDPVESEYRRMLVAKLGGKVKARDAETAFRTAAAAKGADEEKIVAALAGFRRAAESAVAARASAPEIEV